MTGIVPPEYAGQAMLAVTQSVTLFTAMLPPLVEVRQGSQDDPEFAGDVRTGEAVAALLTVGVGAVASSVVGNAVPFAISVFAAATLVGVYEYTLRGKPFAAPDHRRAAHNLFAVPVTTEGESPA
jgi:hypothetical protein